MLLATNTRVWGLIHLGNTIRIESLGYGKRLRLCVELGGRLILVTHWYLFCKVTHHYSEMEGCSLPQTRSIWTELSKQIFCVLFSLSRCFLLLACVYNCSIHFVLVVWLSLVPHIKFVNSVIFYRIHNKNRFLSF